MFIAGVVLFGSMCAIGPCIARVEMIVLASNDTFVTCGTLAVDDDSSRDYECTVINIELYEPIRNISCVATAEVVGRVVYPVNSTTTDFMLSRTGVCTLRTFGMLTASGKAAVALLVLGFIGVFVSICGLGVCMHKYQEAQRQLTR